MHANPRKKERAIFVDQAYMGVSLRARSLALLFRGELLSSIEDLHAFYF